MGKGGFRAARRPATTRRSRCCTAPRPATPRRGSGSTGGCSRSCAAGRAAKSPRRRARWLDSDDLVQATLTETLARVQVFEPRRDHGLHLYLREALRNQIRDELRRLYRDPECAEELPESVPDDAPSPYENTVSDERRERYERALAELPEAERAMVVSRVEFGLSWHDIAALSGKPSADAARMAVSRALVQVARAMGTDERA